MTEPDDDSDEQIVGYGRPPRHSRFKPGQSGNPKGRAKGRLPLGRLLDKHLDARINVTSGGVQKSMTRRHILVAGFVADALQGKGTVRKQLIELLLALDLQNPPDNDDRISDAQDRAIIENFLIRSGSIPSFGSLKSTVAKSAAVKTTAPKPNRKPKPSGDDR